ncbi:MAG TPA: acetyl-CoA carboxylase biotin carboxylase subunit [Pyrinomonadaceae bacterium]|nr:acetyl-CoA carboxylase biotin carboxylase subunit [Pyrinomonadaceae bacterium]
MFTKILIANRGEIACRIIRACRELNVRAVAVYSEADADSLHVRMADEAYLIGPPPSSESYLRIDNILDAARKAGAEAIHPGYGFLSENPSFTRQVEASGLVFIGPPPAAMEAMGGKMSARRIATEAGVPIVPGTTESITDLSIARETAARFGYPIMLKASAGGGGKGMRFVADGDELAYALDAARAEAQASFGDDAVYIEKAIVRPRHIEIQVFSDSHGNHVHLGERECSIQRRHQKVIEECPSPIDSIELREEMGRCAVEIAKAVNYCGAGTVEFLVSDVDRSFYFLEMNTRLQVEHPVTELVTGIDLVREQITVAAGKELSFQQEDIRFAGHAIECRIYAEDADNGFLPSPGRITKLRIPHGSGIRDDGGVYEGWEVSIHYDPMISKFTAYGRDRRESIEKMKRALAEYQISGIKTTIPFFRQVLVDEEFIEGRIDTGFIERWKERSKFKGPDELTTDLSIVAAVISKSNTASHRANASPVPSKWVMTGRRERLDG